LPAAIQPVRPSSKPPFVIGFALPTGVPVGVSVGVAVVVADGDWVRVCVLVALGRVVWFAMVMLVCAEWPLLSVAITPAIPDTASPGMAMTAVKPPDGPVVAAFDTVVMVPTCTVTRLLGAKPAPVRVKVPPGATTVGSATSVGWSGVLVAVGVAVPVAVRVPVAVPVLVPVRVAVTVPVTLGVGVPVGVAVLVSVVVAVGEAVVPLTGLLVAVGVSVAVVVAVAVRVLVAAGVPVREFVGVEVLVLVAVLVDAPELVGVLVAKSLGWLRRSAIRLSIWGLPSPVAVS
jgi:hypothetical protein